MIGSTNDVTRTAGFAPTGTTAAATGALGKEDFLQLLVAQLTQQDPLNPQDGAEFVAQLAQFSSVEQLVNINDGMASLAMAQQASTSAEVVGFIGRDVVALGDTVEVEDDRASFDFSLDGDAETVEIDVLDAEGDVVRTIPAGARERGECTVAWSGADDEAGPLPDGDYTFRVRARDADGETVTATPLTTGRVVGVTYESGYPELMLQGGRRLALADVIRVEREDDGGLAADPAPPSPGPDATTGRGPDAAADRGEVKGSGAADVPVDEPPRWSPDDPAGTADAPDSGPRYSGPDLQSYLDRMMERAGR